MNADGGGVTNLTNDPASDMWPTWSPDSASIAFESDRVPHNLEVFVMDADGRNVRNLTNSPGFDGEPAWSPDGRSIAFATYGRTEQFTRGLFVMNTDGTDQRLVTTASLTNATAPDWSPGGDQLVFMSGDYDVYVVRRDGSGKRLIPTGDTPDSFNHLDLLPVWSPDGTRIAWSRFVGFPFDLDVFSANADGNDRRNLTQTHGPPNTGVHIDENSPAWQPLPFSGNPPQQCRRLREVIGEERFAERYGTNAHGANAFGKCVSSRGGSG
jgi:Tol biopolymer transport system component